MAVVKFHFAGIRPFTLESKKTLQSNIVRVFQLERVVPKHIDYIFCSDLLLLGINRAFLRHNTLTDIVTFNLSPKSEFVDGEIYISSERVKENATIMGGTFDQELLRVIIHGVLHLCGYRDKTKSEKILMTQKEDYYLHLFEK